MTGEVADYDEAVGVGFIRADDGGPTFFFRWDAIKTNAYGRGATPYRQARPTVGPKYRTFRFSPDAAASCAPPNPGR
jgi:hypothetical protein